MKKSSYLILSLILLTFVISLAFYSSMPEQMATHWNARGEVDGYMSKFWGLFLLPLITLILGLLFLAIPYIDPLKKNIQKFWKQYVGFVILLMVFLLVVHLSVILWNLGIEISPNLWMPLALGLLFIYIGVLFNNIKRNWFIGIRTPWTMSSDIVWKKTHQLGSKLFIISGLIALLGMFFQDYVIYFILIPVLAATVIVVVYSYIIFRGSS